MSLTLARLAAVGAYLFATPVLANSVYLRLEDALVRAREQAPSVRIARSEARQAQLRSEGVSKLLSGNPRIQVDMRPPVTGGTWHDMGYSAQAELPLDIAGASASRASELRSEAALLVASADLAGIDAEASACRAYAGAVIAGLRVRSAEALLSAAETLRSAAYARRAAGATGDIDLSIAESELAESRAQLAGLRREHASAQMALRTLLDLPVDTALELQSAMTEVPAVGSLASALERAGQTRPELKLALRRQEVLERTQERLSRDTWPGIGIYGGVDAAPVSPIFGFVGLSVQLPLTLRHRGAKLAAASALSAERERAQVEMRQLSRDVVLSHEAFGARREQLRLLQESMLPAAQRTRELVEIGWRAGRLDIFRVVTAMREVARAEHAQSDALEALWSERAELARQVGAWP